MRLMTCLCLALITALCVLGSGRAYAFEPLSGNRAYPISGHNIVDGQTVALEDLQGKWVYLLFWASW